MAALGGLAVTTYAVLSREPRRPATAVVASFDAAPQPASFGFLELTSDPDAADVHINDEPRGKTPTRIAVPPDVHVITMTLAGRKDFVRQAAVKAGETTPVKGVLPPLTAQLRVSSTPNDATVKLGGVDIGRTPLDRDGMSPAIGVAIAVTKPGFESVRDKVDLVAGELTVRHYPLVEAQRFGKVQISLNASWAEVFDERGKKVGRAAPGGGGPISLPVGRHTLRLRNPGGRGSATVTVDVLEGKTAFIKDVTLH